MTAHPHRLEAAQEGEPWDDVVKALEVKFWESVGGKDDGDAAVGLE